MEKPTAKMHKSSFEGAPSKLCLGGVFETHKAVVPPHERGRSRLHWLGISLRDELANRLISPCQSRLIRQEHDAEVASTGLLSEAGTVDHEHVLVATQFLDEDVVAFRDVDAGKSVESAAGRDTAQARG